MKEIIDKLIDDLSLLSLDLEECDSLLSKIDTRNEDKIENLLVKLCQKYQCNPSIIGRLLIYLQLNNSTSISKYTLSDLKLLFDKSCDVFEDNVELHKEKYFFYFNILDKESTAINELHFFVKNFNEKYSESTIKIIVQTDQS